jgi:hypothetical protein
MLAVAASLAVASSAQAATYSVTGTADLPDPPPCELIAPDTYTCPGLRSAVLAANANPGQDAISVIPGTFNLNLGPLGLDDDVVLVGPGPDATTISAGGETQVLTVAGGRTVSIAGVAIADGFSSSFGGTILVNPGATLILARARVTGGIATSGAGIGNRGTVQLSQTLVDGNTAQAAGGAVFNDGDLSNAVSFTALNSTLAANYAAEGAGVYSDGNATNEVALIQSTVARNTGAGGLSFDGQQDVTLYGSINADNAAGDCRGGQASDARWSVESGTDCGMSDPSNRQGTDSGIAATLTNEGGPTAVLTIPAGSAAVDLVSPCLGGVDQRNLPRTTVAGGACDAGAYEQSSEGGGNTNPPPPPVQTPVPTPPPSATPPPPPPPPTPVANQTVVVHEVSGKVRIKLRGTKRFLDLDATQGIPLGSEIDTKKGAVELTSVSKPGAPPEKATFSEGIFKIKQSRGITVLTLTEKLAACPKKGHAAAAAKKKPKSRRLWGNGKGKFRTAGKYAAATVRGTKWLVQDTCAGTRVRVKQGSVKVRDNVRKKNIVLRAPKSYLAKPK